MREDFNYDTMREWALDFADAGYNVIPLYPVDKKGNCLCGFDECNNAYKHPRLNNWSKALPQSVEQVEALFNAKAYGQSFGIVLSATDFIVDFDPRNNENALNELNDMLGFDIEDHCKYIVRSGSGGKHLYFKKPSSIKTIKIHKEIHGIDFLSEGNFVVGVGSFHKSGYPYEIQDQRKGDLHNIDDAPVDLLDLVERKDVVKESAYGVGSSSEEELRSALAAIPNDEHTDYDYWLNIGMALAYETGNSDHGYGMWEEWSDKSAKHDGTMMTKKWESFRNIRNISNPRTAGTIFKYAHDNGWEQDFDIELDLSEFIRRFEEGKAEKTVLKNSTEDSMELNEIPEQLQTLPGIMGEVVSYILTTAKYPLYLPSINAALAFCSLLVGRDFCTEYENFSSLYLMTVAETGAGKEHPYKIINKILNASNQSSLMKGEVTGKAAIVTELYSNPRALFIKDEIAHWMQIIGSSAASENKKSEVKAWMEIYSKCDTQYASDSYTALSEILKGKVDEAGESSITITRPAVSLLGMTTPHKLSESMTKMMISDGFFNRWMVMFAQEGDQKMNHTSKAKPVPQGILSWIETIERRALYHNRSKSSQGRNSYCNPLQTVEIPFSKSAFDLIDKYEDRILARKKVLRKKGLELMVVRDKERAMKVALIVELAKDPHSIEISGDSTSFSISLVEFCSEQLIKYIEFEMVENSTDRRYKEAYKAIEDCGTDGILQSDLMKRSPFKSSDGNTHKQILTYLIDQTQDVVVATDKQKRRGRPAKRLYASRFINFGEKDGSNKDS